MSIISSMSSQFFKFRVIGESTWTIPAPVMENSESISITSSWSTTNVQGSTEAMSAFNFVNNPTIPINIKFHEDLWRDYNPGHTIVINNNKRSHHARHIILHLPNTTPHVGTQL